MAKRELKILVDKIVGRLEADETLMVSKVRPYIYQVDNNKIKAEILSQVKKGRSISNSQDRLLNKAIAEYSRNMYASFNGYKVVGKPPSFWVQVTGDSALSNINAIKSSNVNTLKQTVFSIFDKEDVNIQQGTSLVETRIAESLARFTPLNPTPINLESSISLAIKSYEKENMDKVFEVLVKGDSKDTLDKARTSISNYISTIRWENQSGSRTPKQIAEAEIAKIVLRKGGKLKGTVNRRKSSPSEAKGTAKFKGKSLPPILVNSNIGKVDIPQKPTINWSRIIPIINARLADAVRQRMIAPRLVNRTGTFASSAKVVGVETTPQGSPSIVFDYQRNPYDVFDRSTGASPWNTPERDPKTLIAMSIRDIVSEMVTSRFYTRRV